MRRNVLAVAVSLLVAAAVFAQAAGDAKPKSAPKKEASKAIIRPAADMKWVDMVGGPPGTKIVTLWGDYTKGAFGAMIKFPAGWSAELHSHTSDMRIIVVSGTFIHGPEGKPEVKLTAGSYLKQAGSGYLHTTKCEAGADCIFFAESTGKFDIQMAEKK